MAGASAKIQRRSTDGIAAFPDDVLLEVLSRVGNVRDLFRLAVTCRRWLRRFTDPAFLCRLCPGQGEGHRARLLGFFFQQTRFLELPRGSINKILEMMRTAQYASVFAPSFLPAPGSPLGSLTADHRDLTAFVPDGGGTFNYAEPLAARRGIVLMRLAPRTLDDFKRMTRTISHLGLCNPITGERHVLPPLECPYHGRCDSYAIVTAADSDDLDGKQTPPAGRFRFSQLLLITVTTLSRSGINNVYLHSYSAGARSWSTPTVCLDGSRFSMTGDRSAVVHRGAAHWLCIAQPCLYRADYKLYKLNVEVGRGTATGNARVSLQLVDIPGRGGSSPLLFVDGDDKLSVACVNFLHVIVWTQQQGGGKEDDDTPGVWLRTSVIRTSMAAPNSPLCQPCGECTWLDFSNGSMLVLTTTGGVFVLDLGNKVMEKIMDGLMPLFFSNQRNFLSPEKHGACVAYDVDLVDFFVTHLARWSM